jgi:hypothetical protein
MHVMSTDFARMQNLGFQIPHLGYMPVVEASRVVYHSFITCPSVGSSSP